MHVKQEQQRFFFFFYHLLRFNCCINTFVFAKFLFIFPFVPKSGTELSSIAVMFQDLNDSAEDVLP